MPNGFLDLKYNNPYDQNYTVNPDNYNTPNSPVFNAYAGSGLANPEGELSYMEKYYKNQLEQANQDPTAWDRVGQIGQGIQALTGLANAYMGYKQYGLAEDQFDFQKGLANRNLVNQTKAYNTNYMDKKKIALAGSGLNETEQAEALAEAEKNLLDTSKI